MAKIIVARFYLLRQLETYNYIYSTVYTHTVNGKYAHGIVNSINV